ncbi:MAG TPA: DUF4254 domain-containing protein, partial [Nannocystaceae bacterium]|nr:DUF4254 domain-containing protein [Nannocystaceae bacterium]
MNDDSEAHGPPGLGTLVAELARINCALWHEEDTARGDDDLAVVRAKRAIDKLNQRRNDTIEKIDDLVVAWARARREEHH